jgi:hypothetical protein
MGHATIASRTSAAMQVRWHLGVGCEPALGAHLVTARGAYSHHGIYVGKGKVVHYAGLARSLHRGPVEEVTIACFAAGRELWIQPRDRPGYADRQVVERARSRLGENRYRLLTNNCEHFCTWCLYGESRSEQVRACLTYPRAAMGAAVGLFKMSINYFAAMVSNRVHALLDVKSDCVGATAKGQAMSCQA